MKSILGAKLLTCLLNEKVKDAPIPPTATKRALPDITIKIVNIVLSFLSLRDAKENTKISLIFTPFSTLVLLYLLCSFKLDICICVSLPWQYDKIYGKYPTFFAAA
jgi:hypothetical protein